MNTTRSRGSIRGASSASSTGVLRGANLKIIVPIKTNPTPDGPHQKPPAGARGRPLPSRGPGQERGGAAHSCRRLRATLSGGPHLGPRQPQDQGHHQRGFGHGADEAFIVTDDALIGADQVGKALAIAKAIEKIGGADVIISAKVPPTATPPGGPACAELLGVPEIGYARKLTGGPGIQAERSMETS